MNSVLRQVSIDARVEFAQTIEEIQQVAGSSVDIINGSWATHFLDTCWVWLNTQNAKKSA